MIKKLAISFSLLAMTVLPVLANADEVRAPRDAASGQATGKRQYAPGGIVKEAQGEIKEMRSAALNELQAKREEAAEAFKMKREELRKEITVKREDMKAQVEAKREELKKRLEVVRDEKKKETVEKMDRRLDEINNNRTDHYLNVLEKITGALGRIETRTGKAVERGLDVAAVRTAIDAAKAAIGIADVAVKAQAGKTYKIAVTTEAGLRAAVKAAHDALKADLGKVHAAVKAAHDAVRKAGVALAQIDKGNDDDDGDGHATTTPTSTPVTTTP